MGFLSSLFGVSDRTPKTSTNVISTKLPEELSPYVKEVLGEAQDLYKAEIDRGFDPYTGQMIAPLTTEEQQAMAGISGLTGTTKPYLEEALETYRKGGDEFTAETAEKFMSPYQQAVTDIQLREAKRKFEGDTLPRLEKQAVDMGGMSGLGSRAGVEMAEAQRSQNQLLADIQAKGSQAAYQDARQGFEAQQARERTMATDVGRMGPAMFQAGLTEQGALQTVGEQKRQLGQSALDEAYGKFLQEKNFPKQQLSDYSSTVYGSAPSFDTGAGSQTTSSLPGAPSMGQQLLGLGMTGLNIYGAGTAGGTQGFNWGAAGKGMGFRKEGGQVSGGLSTIRLANGGPTWGDYPTDPEFLESVRIEDSFQTQPEPASTDNFGAETMKAIKQLQQDIPGRAEEMKGIRTKFATDQRTMSEAADKKQSDFSDASFSKREAEIKRRREKYPFASIQKAIAAGMKQPTIAMMLTEGVAVGGAELEKKADELDNMMDALEGLKFNAKSKEMSVQAATNLNNLKTDANLQLELVKLDTNTQLKVIEALSKGMTLQAAIAKASGASKVGKLTASILNEKSNAIQNALGFKGDFVVGPDGKSNFVGKRADGKDLTDVDVRTIADFNVTWSTAFANAQSTGYSEVQAGVIAQQAVIDKYKKGLKPSKVTGKPPPGNIAVANPSTPAQTLAPVIK
jgi:hypothetical protein|tara:strand:+ start:346 stop:2385 length:2040 start_codon:yes stop_codon:yes gene_type:complete